MVHTEFLIKRSGVSARCLCMCVAEELAALESSEADLLELVEQRKKESEEEERKADELAAQLAALSLTADALPSQLASLEAAEAAQRAKAAAKAREVALAEARKKEESNNLKRDISQFERVLGLTFTVENNQNLRCCFRLLDELNPDREFYFSVFVDENEAYQVSACEPAINETRLDELIDQVNQTNSFARFLYRMRMEFQSLIRQERG